MKKTIVCMVLVVLLLTVNSVVFAADDSLALSSSDADSIRVVLPEEYYEPVPIYDGDEYLGYAYRVPGNMSRATRASWSINWSVSANSPMHGTTSRLVGNNTTFGYNINANPTASTDIGFYRINAKKYLWLDTYSRKSNFRLDGATIALTNPESMYFAIKNTDIRSTTYTGTFSLS